MAGINWWIFLLHIHILVVQAATENCTRPPPYRHDRPLYLTPFIVFGDLEEAKSLSKVEFPTEPNVTSHSGFLTVDGQPDMNIFFWFILCQRNSSDAPIILWLNDGLEEASSLFGAFGEIGPFKVAPDLRLKPRKHNWASSHNLLFIDAPVGTGFSYANSDKDFTAGSTDVAVHVNKALQQFFTLFSEYATNDLYLAGSAYASKHVCSLAYLIHSLNRSASISLNLKGIVVMSSTIEFTQLIFVQDQLYNLGLIGNWQKLYMERRTKLVNDHLNAGRYEQAFRIFDSLFLGISSMEKTTLQNFTGYRTYHNALHVRGTDRFLEVARFLNQTHIRNVLHLGDATLNGVADVQKSIYGDIMKPLTTWLELLLSNGYKCLALNGQFDLLVTPPAHEKFLRNLKWRGTQGFQNAPRTMWKILSEDKDSRDIAGYVSHSQNLYSVTINSGGHRIAGDQPRPVVEALNMFTSNGSFTDYHC